MPLFSCKLAYLVPKFQRLRKIVERKARLRRLIPSSSTISQRLGSKFGDLGIRHRSSLRHATHFICVSVSAEG